MKIPNYTWAEKRLWPYPFCGHKHIQILPQPEGWYLIRCLQCPANMRVFTTYQRQLIAAWNRQPPRDTTVTITLSSLQRNYLLEALRVLSHRPCRHSNCGTACLCAACAARRVLPEIEQQESNRLGQ